MRQVAIALDRRLWVKNV